MIEKKITVTAGDDEFEFCVKTNDYNSYINALKPDDKIAPSSNFLRRTLVDKEKLEKLNALIDAGVGIDIASSIINEFRPEVEIAIKK